MSASCSNTCRRTSLGRLLTPAASPIGSAGLLAADGGRPRPAEVELPGLRDDRPAAAAEPAANVAETGRGRPGPALLAHVLVAKYVDHSPLNRQSKIDARAGVELDRSTLAALQGLLALSPAEIG